MATTTEVPKATFQLNFSNMVLLTEEQELEMKQKEEQQRLISEAEAFKDVLERCGMPKRFRESSYSETNIHELIKAYNRSAGNLLIYGNITGTGKTESAAWLMRRIKRVSPLKTTRFVEVSSLVIAMRGTYSNDSKETAETIALQYSRCDYLFLDDLGSEAMSSDVYQLIFAIMNQRWSEQRPTIITSNLSPVQIIERYKDKISSRILAGIQVNYDVPGARDNRIKKA